MMLILYWDFHHGEKLKTRREILYLRATSLFLKCGVKRSLKCMIFESTYVVTRTNRPTERSASGWPDYSTGRALHRHRRCHCTNPKQITLKHTARITHFKLRGLSLLILKSTPVRTFRNSAYFISAASF